MGTDWADGPYDKCELDVASAERDRRRDADLAALPCRCGKCRESVLWRHGGPVEGRIVLDRDVNAAVAAHRRTLTA